MSVAKLRCYCWSLSTGRAGGGQEGADGGAGEEDFVVDGVGGMKARRGHESMGPEDEVACR